MAESFLFVIATNVLNKISSLAYQEVSSCWCFKSDLTKLHKTMSTIQAVLLDAEQKQSKDNRLRLWLSELKDVFYDAEDVLDELECEEVVKRHKKLSRFFSNSNPIVFRLKIAHKINGIRERLDRVAHEKSSFGLTESVEVKHVFPVERMNHSFVSAPEVFGRDDDKEKIINILMQSNVANIPLIPIVGIGGLGKTTLVKMVYNDKRLVAIVLCYQLIGSKSKSIRAIRFIELEGDIDAASFVNARISKFKCLRQLGLCNLVFEVLSDSIGALKHLRRLNLSWNYKLTELPESICEIHHLQTLMLVGCPMLKKLPDNVQNMISLRYYLSISMNGMGISNDGIQGLSSLRYLWLDSFGKPDLESLFASGIQSLTALQTLGVTDCYNLVSLPACTKYLTRLENLWIDGCGNINMKMELQEEHLRSSLRSFTIRFLDSLVDLPQLILEGSARTLQHLKIEYCPRLVTLPEWLRNLTALQKLEIIHCRGLSSLPEGMERLTALRELRIQGCPALLESCKQDMSKIAHIPEIHLG